MKGAALKNDVDVDVSTLFQYAADKVPDLVRGVGGVQKPQIIAPLGGASFDLGQLLPEDKQQIPLAAVRPVILRPTLLNAEALTDDLQLMLAVRKQLREETYAGSRGGDSAASAIFVDDEEMPGAIRPSGTYTVDRELVAVKLVLTRDAKKIRIEVQGPVGDASGLATKIAAAILEASKNF